MKNKLHYFGLAIFCLSAIVSRAQTDKVMAKNYADILVWSVGVTNPKHAVDADTPIMRLCRQTSVSLILLH